MRAEAGTAFCPVRPAAMEVQKIERLAGGEKIWPMDGPVWRLRGGAVGAIEELAQSCLELGRTARVSRFLAGGRTVFPGHAGTAPGYPPDDSKFLAVLCLLGGRQPGGV